MSWDVMVFDFGGTPKPFRQLTDADQPYVMGTSAEVRAKIDTHLPNVDWSDPTWRLYVGDGFSFELSMDDEVEKRGFMVHVRGGGDAISALFRFATPNKWSLLDCSTTDWLNPDKPSQVGWKGFQVLRDKGLGNP